MKSANTMTDYNGHGSLYLFIVTGFFYLLSIFERLNLQQWASVMTIMAGAGTLGYTIYKWVVLYKRVKQNKDEQL